MSAFRRSGRRAAFAVPACALALLLPAARPAAAQEPAPPAAPVVERPVPFDSGGRVLLLTPALAARLQLAPPAFPVRGPFVEARLFASPGAGPAGPAVLSVTRPGGAIERYPLGAAERAALVAAVAGGLAAAGPGLRGDTTLVVSEPAGRAFVRNQTLLGLLLYGPAAAGLTGGDGSGASLAYAASAGAAFAISLGVTRNQPVTRAQAALSGGMATGGAAAAAGLTYALTGTESGEAYAAAVLLGGIGGSVLGFQRGRGMTDAEAAASNTAAVLGVATAAGVAGALGAYTSDNGRPTVGAGVAALAAGHALGPRYARTRRYTVTAGDVQTLTPLALTGAAFGASAAWAANGGGGQSVWAGATAGFVAGAVAADRVLVRRFDHTPSEGDLLQLGTFVGAGLGAALATSLDESDDLETAGGLALTGLGALAGIAVAEAFLSPARAGEVRLRTGLAPAGTPRRRLRLSPAGLVLARATAARGGRGTFPLGSLTF